MRSIYYSCGYDISAYGEMITISYLILRHPAFAIRNFFCCLFFLVSYEWFLLSIVDGFMQTPMIHKRGDLTASVVDGKIYVIGGFTETFDRFSLVEAYDPDTGSWERHEDMPTPRGDVGSAVHKGCIYATGGWNSNPEPNSGGYTDAVERFCPGESPEWTKFPDLVSCLPSEMDVMPR